jgi:hypothetical protein
MPPTIRARSRPLPSARLAALRAALGFLRLPPRATELRLLHHWLDSWAGLGLIAVGLHRQGWDLQLTQYGDGRWRATFHVTGAAHSIVGGSAWEPTPWRAVQMAAWETLTKGPEGFAGLTLLLVASGQG